MKKLGYYSLVTATLAAGAYLWFGHKTQSASAENAKRAVHNLTSAV